MARLNKTERTKKALLKALVDSLGIVTKACKEVDVSRTTFYTYYNDDEDFRNACDDVQDIALDEAEEKLHDLIKDKNPTAIIFYLKTKGKKRGFIERQEIDANISGRITQGKWDGEEDPEEFLEHALSK